METQKELTSFPTLEEILKVASELREDPTRFSYYYDKPFEFVTEVLGVTTLWDAQIEILEAPVKFRNSANQIRIAIRSGHGIGKSFALACLIIWWFYARQGIVITTAPTWKHVEDVLWREINTLHRNSKVHLPGDIHGTKLSIDRTWYALGLSTTVPSAFQGRHHPNLLCVADEAAGVDEQVLFEMSMCATGADNAIIYIGNPTSTVGSFYDAFENPDLWHCMHVSCLQHPNVVSGQELIKGAVTKQWVEEHRAKWGEKSPLWAIRVLGEFPELSSRGVIPLAWIQRQINEDKRLAALKLAEELDFPRIGGLDVARYGENKTVLTIRRGDAIESWESWSGRNLMETTGLAARAIEEKGLGLLVVDASGIGAGVADRLLEQGYPILAYNGGHRAFTPSSFSNRRSEMWWYLRERFERGQIWMPKDCAEYITDLRGPTYEISSSGRIKVVSKERMIDDGHKSPDFGDSLVLCFAADEDPEAVIEAPREPNRDPWNPEPVDTDSPFSQLPWGF